MDALRFGMSYEPQGNTKMKHFKATIKEKGMDVFEFMDAHKNDIRSAIKTIKKVV